MRRLAILAALAAIAAAVTAGWGWEHAASQFDGKPTASQFDGKQSG